MSNLKYMDFDLFFSEAKKESTMKIKLFDKEYSLPDEIPASIMLDMFRAHKSGESEISDEKQLALAFKMLGEENVNEWCDRGLSINQLAEIMKWAASQYSKTNDSAGESKKK